MAKLKKLVKNTAAAKPLATKVTPAIRSLIDGLPVVLVSPSSLKMDPGNPKKHGPRNRQAIRDSLEKFGQIEPLLVQKRTSIIIGGNERLSVIKDDLKWSKVAVVFLDVDDRTRKELSIVLNRTPELGEWDDKNLASILSELQTQNITPAGYSDAEVEALVERIAAPSLPPELSRANGIPWSKDTANPTVGEGGMPEADLAVPTSVNVRPDETLAAPIVGEVDDEEDLRGTIFTLKEDVIFPSKEIFEIPPMRMDMLASVPNGKVIGTYLKEDTLGKIAKGSREDDYEVVTWGGDADNVSDWSNKIVGFYTEDDAFNNCWFMPNQFASILINRKPYAVIAPNFSTGLMDPTAVRVYQHYKRQWVARYWQEAGIRVIPDVWIGNCPRSCYSYAFSGIPKGAPLIAFEIQSHEVSLAKDEAAFKKDKTIFRDNFNAMLNTLQPKALLIYGAGTCKKRDELLDGVLPSGLKVHIIMDRTRARMRAHDAMKKAAQQQPVQQQQLQPVLRQVKQVKQVQPSKKKGQGK